MATKRSAAFATTFGIVAVILTFAALRDVASASFPSLERTDDAGVAELARRSGVALEGVRAARADVFIEPAVDLRDRTWLAGLVDADVASVETAFRRGFSPRPSIYVFATDGSFQLGLQVLFRYQPSSAYRLAANHAGVLEPASRSVAINWRRAYRERRPTIFRHELAHAMVRQIVGPEAQVPAWFDEGLAMLAQRTPEDGADASEDRDTATALASTGRVSLADLTTVPEWIAQSEALSGRTYAVAAEAVRLLEQEVGRDALLRILDETGRRVPFPGAFAAVTGQPLSRFVAALPRRLAADASGPSISTQAPAAGTRDVWWSVRGFAPSAKLTVRIEGRGYALTYAVEADEMGRHRGTFGSTAPPGAYAIRVESGGVSVSAIIQTTGND